MNQVYLLGYDLLTFIVCSGTLVYVLQLREWLLDDWMVKHAAWFHLELETWALSFGSVVRSESLV